MANASSKKLFCVRIRRTNSEEKMAAKKTPWRKPNPKKKKKGGSGKLSPAQKVRAKRSARKAGRPYPNLVDNMLVARKSKKRKKGRGS